MSMHEKKSSRKGKEKNVNKKGAANVGERAAGPLFCFHCARGFTITAVWRAFALSKITAVWRACALSKIVQYLSILETCINY